MAKAGLTGADRVATCWCGQLQARCTGDPVRVSVCHCLDCKKRSGSAFAAQARWPDESVEMTGQFSVWTHQGQTGNRAHFRFCPVCSSTVAYLADAMPGLTAIPIGAFGDPDFPPPEYSVYEERKHAWVAIVGEGIDHFD
jgi:hypothetical protein